MELFLRVTLSLESESLFAGKRKGEEDLVRAKNRVTYILNVFQNVFLRLNLMPGERPQEFDAHYTYALGILQA